VVRRIVEPCRQSGSLAEVAAQLHHQHAAIYRGYFFQQLVSAVAGAVINQDEFERVADLLHHLFQAGVENCYVLLFIVERHDDRILRHI
jgi:hypothetical protein